MKKLLKSKKVIMIAAMVLMVALVVGMGAMTYSRYVSSADMGDATQATVAKWGYVVTFSADNMFGKQYEDGKVTTSTSGSGDDSLDVKASGTSAVVAPGTSGYVTATINGISEVLAEFKMTLDATDIVLYYKETADGEVKSYYPLTWTLYEGESTVKSSGNLSEVESYIETNYKSELAPGTQITDKVYKVEWSWKLDIGNEANIDPDDKLDTMLGLMTAYPDLANANAQVAKLFPGYSIVDDSTNDTVTQLSYDMAVTITQIQD